MFLGIVNKRGNVETDIILYKDLIDSYIQISWAKNLPLVVHVGGLGGWFRRGAPTRRSHRSKEH